MNGLGLGAWRMFLVITVSDFPPVCLCLW